MHSRRGGSSSPRFLNKTQNPNQTQGIGNSSANSSKHGASRRVEAAAAGESRKGLTTTNNSMKNEWRGYVLILLLSAGVYWNSLDGDFVHDDIVSVVRNPDVRPGSSWTNLWKNDYWGTAMASPSSHKSYRPLTVLTFR